MVCIVRLRPRDRTQQELNFLVFLFIYRGGGLVGRRKGCDALQGLIMVPLESAAGQGRDPMQS